MTTMDLNVPMLQFMTDCSDVMSILLKTQTDWEHMPEDDPQVS